MTNKSLVSAAIAKGKFTRNIFQGQEGNQGPYKLAGANNELYFVVLAGTEKVYIDGKLMQRGEDQDYVINYNTAEVTFTAQPDDHPGRVPGYRSKFEYADRNYLPNVNLYLADEVEINKKLRLRAAFFSNSDSRNSPINQTLDPDQTKFLSELGDSISHAASTRWLRWIRSAWARSCIKRSIRPIRTPAACWYTTRPISFPTILRLPFITCRFTNVGVGYGNYVPDLNGVNGNVYLWIAPVNGVMQGSYEAAQFLVTPKTQRVVTLGADYTPWIKNTAGQCRGGQKPL